MIDSKEVLFEPMQLAEIELGKEEGLHILEYAKPDFDWLQMREIRIGMEKKVNFKEYADPKMDFLIMREIRLAMENKVNLSKYVKKGYSGVTLREIRLALEDGVNLDWYLKNGYEGHQLLEIRLAVANRYQIRNYITVQMRAVQIAQIRKGLEKKVDVHAYADEEYSWQQMQEIRLGLEKHLDVSKYLNHYYSWQQMQEIRLGLAEGLDVSDYAKLQFSLLDMKSKRANLLRKYQINQKDTDKLELIASSEFATLYLSLDAMKAYIELKIPKDNQIYNTDDITKFLMDNSINKGLCIGDIQTAVRDKMYYERIPVAIGKAATTGKDGFYEYLFNENNRINLSDNIDGTINYLTVFNVECVKVNQKVAVYHSALNGQDGYNVHGEVIPAKRGQDMPVLECVGVRVSDDGKNYYASYAGRIEVHDSMISVYKLLSINENYRRGMEPIDFEGDVLIRGSVMSGVTIKATHHIMIDGNVEPSELIAGGDVFIRVGMAGKGTGVVRAHGRIFGNWFESCELYADSDVYAIFLLHCNVECYGKLMVTGSKGTIIGGNLYALIGMEANVFGNSSQVRTRLMIGANDQIVDDAVTTRIEYTRLSNVIEEYEDKLRKLEGRLIHDEVKNAYTKIKLAMEVDMEERDKLKPKLDYINALMEKDKRAKIIVRRGIFPGCVIQVGEVNATVADEMNNLTIKNVAGQIKYLF